MSKTVNLTVIRDTQMTSVTAQTPKGRTVCEARLPRHNADADAELTARAWAKARGLRVREVVVMGPLAVLDLRHACALGQLYRDALRSANWCVTRAAERLGCHRSRITAMLQSGRFAELSREWEVYRRPPGRPKG